MFLKVGNKYQAVKRVRFVAEDRAEVHANDVDPFYVEGDEAKALRKELDGQSIELPAPADPEPAAEAETPAEDPKPKKGRGKKPEASTADTPPAE